MNIDVKLTSVLNQIETDVRQSDLVSKLNRTNAHQADDVSKMNWIAKFFNVTSFPKWKKIVYISPSPLSQYAPTENFNIRECTFNDSSPKSRATK